jgi:hypothetical protein
MRDRGRREHHATRRSTCSSAGEARRGRSGGELHPVRRDVAPEPDRVREPEARLDHHGLIRVGSVTRRSRVNVGQLQLASAAEVAGDRGPSRRAERPSLARARGLMRWQILQHEPEAPCSHAARSQHIHGPRIWPAPNLSSHTLVEPQTNQPTNPASPCDQTPPHRDTASDLRLAHGDPSPRGSRPPTTRTG